VAAKMSGGLFKFMPVDSCKNRENLHQSMAAKIGGGFFKSMPVDSCKNHPDVAFGRLSQREFRQRVASGILSLCEFGQQVM
jgi:hypothetical protein